MAELRKERICFLSISKVWSAMKCTSKRFGSVLAKDSEFVAPHWIRRFELPAWCSCTKLRVQGSLFFRRLQLCREIHISRKGTSGIFWTEPGSERQGRLVFSQKLQRNWATARVSDILYFEIAVTKLSNGKFVTLKGYGTACLDCYGLLFLISGVCDAETM